MRTFSKKEILGRFPLLGRYSFTRDLAKKFLFNLFLCVYSSTSLFLLLLKFLKSTAFFLRSWFLLGFNFFSVDKSRTLLKTVSFEQDYKTISLFFFTKLSFLRFGFDAQTFFIQVKIFRLVTSRRRKRLSKTHKCAETAFFCTLRSMIVSFFPIDQFLIWKPF